MSDNVKEKLTIREWLPLIGMTFAAFLFNTSEFMPIGLLSTIAEDFAMTEAEIGRIVSIYAWVVMILSMPLMVMASRYGLRNLILSTLAVFILSNSLASIATDFWTLLGARLILACAHAIYWSIATPAVVRMVAPQFKTIAMSMLIAGSSMAVILGMPLGRVIGLHAGWRMSFLTMAIIAACTLTYLCFVFPKLEKTEKFTFKQLPELFRNKTLMGLFAIAALVPTAQYAAYSYIEPFMKFVAKMPDNMVTINLMILGCAGLLGSAIFARTYEKHVKVFLTLSIAGIAVSHLLLYPATVNEFAMIVLFIFWGVCMTCFGMASQADLMAATTVSAAPVAMSIYSGIFNFGIGSGTWVGGMICDHIDIAYIGYGAGILTILGTIFSAWLASHLHKKH